MAGGQQIIDIVLEPAQAGWRLDRALAAAVPTLSRERLKALAELGPAEIHLHQVGRNQRAFIETFGREVLPRLREH